MITWEGMLKGALSLLPPFVHRQAATSWFGLARISALALMRGKFGLARISALALMRGKFGLARISALALMRGKFGLARISALALMRGKNEEGHCFQQQHSWRQKNPVEGTSNNPLCLQVQGRAQLDFYVCTDSECTTDANCRTK
ncbi:hypothetical protein B0O80DRAFT_488660 [Mortierella sp. GBAus27b]|nr:hypothetical protein B0O80DRAFT_488660 [Mortierella sp. GBAus27b]